MWGARKRKNKRKAPAGSHTGGDLLNNMELGLQERLLEANEKRKLIDKRIETAKENRDLLPQDRIHIHDRADITQRVIRLRQKRKLYEDKIIIEDYGNKIASVTAVTRKSSTYRDHKNTSLTNTGLRESRLVKNQKHALYLTLFTKSKAPCYYEVDICDRCGNQLVLTRNSKANCKSCGLTKDRIYKMTNVISTTKKDRHPYRRDGLYRKYLEQFSEDSPLTPKHVIEVVYKELFRVHAMIRTKTKSTPIATILRNNGLQEWVGYAFRIAKEANGEKIASLTSTLIDRLVDRFRIITKTNGIITANVGRKTINFEFLTSQFLHMEKHSELAVLFYNHRTRTTLKKSFLRLQSCLDEITKMNDTGMEWSIRRVC